MCCGLTKDEHRLIKMYSHKFDWESCELFWLWICGNGGFSMRFNFFILFRFNPICLYHAAYFDDIRVNVMQKITKAQWRLWHELNQQTIQYAKWMDGWMSVVWGNWFWGRTKIKINNDTKIFRADEHQTSIQAGWHKPYYPRASLSCLNSFSVKLYQFSLVCVFIFILSLFFVFLEFFPNFFHFLFYYV